MTNDKQLAAQALAAVLDNALSEAEITNLLETPKKSEMGDLAFPVFSLAKTLRKAPNMIALDLVEKIVTTGFEKVVATGPYVNCFLDKSATATAILSEILTQGTAYATMAKNGENVAIDMSSPNIAKPFSIGHLRSTVIGDALAEIYSKIGYTPVSINHLGDWGKQFGMLIVAYKKYGNEAAIRKNPISELLKLYVQINAEAAEDPTVDEAAREWFLKLENGDAEALALWQWFRDESLVEFDRIYKELGVTFDSMFTIHEDWSAFLEKFGVKISYIHAGKYKVDGNFEAPLGEEARSHIQSIVDDAYRLFVEDVARGRKTAVAAVKAGYGEGRVLTAKDAKAAGLIDRVAGFEETMKRLSGMRAEKIQNPKAKNQNPDGGNSQARNALKRRRLELLQKSLTEVER